MGETPTFKSEAIDWSDIGDQFMTGVMKAATLGDLRKSVVSTLTEKEAAVAGFLFDVIIDVATKLGEAMHKLETPLLPIIAAFVAPVIAGLFNAEVDEATFAKRLQAGGGAAAGGAIVDGFIKAIDGDGSGARGPSTEGARRIAAAAVTAALESTVNAAVTEMVSDFAGEFGPRITALTEIPEEIMRALGIGRLVRRAYSPAIDAMCATPAKWFYAQKYLQARLGPGVVAKQVARGRWSQQQAKDELDIQGWSDDRIEALINDALKFLGPADLYWLVRAHEWSIEDARQHLQDSGYDSPLAALAMEIEQIKQIAAFEDALATAAVDAFAAGRIDESTLGGFVHGSTFTDQHVAQLVELAHARHALGAKPLTASEAETAVMLGIATFADYRAALAHENRTDDAIVTLDLVLRAKKDAATTIADHKKAQADEIAAAKQAKIDAAAAKKQAHDDAVAKAKRGKPADLAQAYLRGLIPIARVQEVWATLYDADTVATLSATLEDKRAALVKQQQAADAAKARAAQRGINVNQLSASVRAGVTTLQSFSDRLKGLGFTDADISVLTATLAAEIQAAKDAKTLHADAVAKAAIKHVDLPTLELLVRRGHRTIADFTAALTALGYDVAAVAALDDKLQIEIDADHAAATAKADAAAKAAAKGLNLAQASRAVVLGVLPIDAFKTVLGTLGIDAAAQVTIAATVQAERDQAQAAQQRRAAADARRDAPRISLADLAKAARLNLIPVSTYTAALTARGYSAADVALDTDLLTTEIANTVAAQQKHDAAAAAAKQKRLNLRQLDAAVIAGELPIASYTQRVIDLGFSPDDAALVASVVKDRADVAAAARARAAQLATDDPGREVKRADVEKAVLDGIQTIDDYRAWLTAQKYGDDDVDLAVALLQFKLDAAAAKAAGAA